MGAMCRHFHSNQESKTKEDFFFHPWQPHYTNNAIKCSQSHFSPLFPAALQQHSSLNETTYIPKRFCGILSFCLLPQSQFCCLNKLRLSSIYKTWSTKTTDVQMFHQNTTFKNSFYCSFTLSMI